MRKIKIKNQKLKSKIKSGFAPLVLIIVIGIVLAAGGLGLGLAWRAGLFGKPGGPKDGTTTNGTQPTPPPQPPPSNGEEDPTKDWEVYTNGKYDYRIRYPKEWFLGSVDDPKMVDFFDLEPPFDFSENPHTVSLLVEDNPNSFSAKEYVDQILNGYDPETRTAVEKELKRTNYTVGEQQAEEVVGFVSAYGTVEVFVPKGSLMFHLLVTPYEVGNVNDEKAADVFRLMVKTFEFVAI